MNTPTILRKIVARKFEEIDSRQRKHSAGWLAAEINSTPPTRGFTDALLKRGREQTPAIIAEIKKASPSKGVIREDFDPEMIARSYERGGAACLSVLTDEDFFQGSDAYLQQARNATSLPVIRKDFMVHEYQLLESRFLGADCILLIVAALEPAQLNDLHQQALELGLDVLVEVHNESELDLALELPNPLVGINNRDLHTFEVSLETTFRLLPRIASDKMVITESGIFTRDDVQVMIDQSIYGFLIGESFMRAPEPGEKLREVFGPYL